VGQLGDQIRAGLAGDPAEGAIQFKGQWRSRGELNGIVLGLDQAFEALGLGPGAAVGCILRNRPEHAAVMLGLFSGGQCLVTLNGLLPDGRLAEDILAAKPPVIVATAEDWDRPAVREAAAAIGAAGVRLTGEVMRPVDFAPGLDRMGAGPHTVPAAGTAVLMLTSGTTGAPKRVPLKFSVIERQLEEAFGASRHGPGEAPPPPSGASVLAGSFVHIGGLWGLLGAARSGRPICLLEKFNVADWRQAVVEHRPSSVGAPPAALRMILDANIPREDLASLVSIGAGTAALDPAIVDEFLERYDIPIVPNYGATEFAAAVASWSIRGVREHWADKRGAVGRIHKSFEARVVDAETGEPVPFGEEGILELQGFAVGDEGVWVRTTDRAVLDADRYLWIRGRADNAINRGGFKVRPDEVVAVLQSHPAVLEASVVGLPDRRLGQTPVAAVILKAGAEPPSEAELADWVRGRMMAYCVPTAFRFVDELPRTPSLKVSTPAVRELFADGAPGLASPNRAAP
jgi:acyl-coenzyme A synthetase/AMP-(fatty) acid ligase